MITSALKKEKTHGYIAASHAQRSLKHSQKNFFNSLVLISVGLATGGFNKIKLLLLMTTKLLTHFLLVN